jgi:hypothetical protein
MSWRKLKLKDSGVEPARSRRRCRRNANARNESFVDEFPVVLCSGSIGDLGRVVSSLKLSRARLRLPRPNWNSGSPIGASMQNILYVFNVAPLSSDLYSLRLGKTCARNYEHCSQIQINRVLCFKVTVMSFLLHKIVPLLFIH